MPRPSDQTRRDAESLMAELVSDRDSILADAMEFEVKAADMRGRADRLDAAIQELYKVLDE